MAERRLNEAIAVLNGLGNDNETLQCYEVLSIVYLSKSKFDEVESILLKSLEAYKKSRFQRGQATILQLLSNLYQTETYPKKCYETSLDFAKKAFELNQKIGNVQNSAKSLISLACALEKMKKKYQ